MDHINREDRVFQEEEEEDFNENIRIQSLLSQVDRWERQSISKIQKTAEIARNDLLKILDRTKNQFKSALEKGNQSTEQLKQLRHLYQTSFPDDMIDEQQSSISLIKIIDKSPSFTLNPSSSSLPGEKFNKIIGSVTLSEDHLTATCSDKHWNGSNISGTNLYSSGIHSIRFRISKIGKNNLFFGITSSLKESNPWNRKTPFAYGWWEIPLNYDEKKLPKHPEIKTGDEVTLTLDCIGSQIQFEHHRTNRYIDETITNEQCPLPWRIAIVLYSPGDSVSILST